MSPVDDFLSTLASQRTVERNCFVLEEFTRKTRRMPPPLGMGVLTTCYRSMDSNKAAWNLFTPVEVRD